MHHALAGWADWPDWAEMLGGKFLYRCETLRGRQCLDSGYRHDVDYDAVVLADHPVTRGLPARFAMCDELYLAEIFAEDVTPLIAADHAFAAHNFYSAAHAVAGRMFDDSDWPHPPGSALLAWTKPVGAGHLVYLQFGDGPAAYAHPHVQRVLANALDYVT
jgi:type 1 glutamine amidotransferase